MRKLLVLLLLLPTLCFGAIAEVGTSISCDTGVTPDSQMTCAHDSGSTGFNRITLIGISGRSFETPTVITYGGQTAALLIERDEAGGVVSLNCSIYYLVDPPTGSNNAQVDFGISLHYVVGLATYSQVNQSAPFTANIGASTSSSNSDPATVNIASAAGELVVDTVSKRGSTGSLTAGTNQTEEWDDVSADGTASANVRGGGSKEAGGATITMSWALGGTERWTICAGSMVEDAVAPAGPASGGMPIFFP